MMKPGTVYPVDVDQMVTAVILAPEHRLRIEVSSSNFPAYERNLNTGGQNQRESVGRVARNSIWHDPEHQSFLEISLTDTSIWK
jgi:predicted acyl esterase